MIANNARTSDRIDKNGKVAEAEKRWERIQHLVIERSTRCE